ncbi:MAG: PIG-L family deacetylase [Asgard group archaeon]|nr:PIG-L family deacetylase [Asgard group archaeon]
MKLAFIFAHPDDESLSTGGTIAKYAAEGDQVITVCLSSDSVRKSEYFEAVKALGIEENLIFDYPDVHKNEQLITQRLIEFILDFKPDIIITHIEEDYHIDHKSTFKIVRECIEWAAHETQYENPHLVSKLYTSETTVLLPNPHIFIDITEFYQKKEKAIRCYKSQLHKGGDDFYINFHRYRTLMRGTQASVKYAEAFMQIPLKKNSPFYKIKHSEL